MIPRSDGSLVGGVVTLMFGSGDGRTAVQTSMILRAALVGVGVVTTPGGETEDAGDDRSVAP